MKQPVYHVLLVILLYCCNLSAQQFDPNFYILQQGQAVAPWQLSLQFGQKVITNSTVATLKKSLVAKPVNLDGKLAAMRFLWNPKGIKNQWGSVDTNVLTANIINKSTWVDWSMFKNRAAMLITTQINKKPTKAVTLTLECNWDWHCRTAIPIKNLLKRLPTQQWLQVPIPLSCFNNNPDFDFSKVTTPFMLQSQGKLSLDIANIQLVVSEKPLKCY